MKLKTIIATVVIITTFTACQKPEKGEAGTPGKDGNANVQSVSLNVTGWSWDATNYWRYSSWTNVSLLTQDVIDGGAVMLYQKMSSGEYIALPISANITSTVQEHDYFSYNVGTLKIIIENSDLSDPNPAGYLYKLVCIPKAARIKNPNVNMLNYGEVKKAYDIE